MKPCTIKGTKPEVPEERISMAAITTLLPVFFMLALGQLCRRLHWVTPEQKDGANTILFGILFPILVFNLLASADLSLSVLPVVGYVFLMFLIPLLVVGPLTARFTGKENAHFSKYLLTTVEGGNVALPLYLSIVGASSTTVVFDLAGSIIAFVVVPIMVAGEAAKGARAGDIVRSMVTNPFLIAVTAGVLLNVTGLYGAIVASDFGPAITSTLSMATSPIVALILFILGYDLTVEKDTIVPILKLSVVRIAWFALIILGFFLLFGQRMADRDFMLAVIIYFACPTGFAMSTLIQPLYKGDREPGFVSAFTSLYVVVTLVVYTLVVLFLA